MAWSASDSSTLQAKQENNKHTDRLAQGAPEVRALMALSALASSTYEMVALTCEQGQSKEGDGKDKKEQQRQRAHQSPAQPGSASYARFLGAWTHQHQGDDQREGCAVLAALHYTHPPGPRPEQSAYQQQGDDQRKVCVVQQRDGDDGSRLHGPGQRIPHILWQKGGGGGGGRRRGEQRVGRQAGNGQGAEEGRAAG